jgi:hypothetical protein
MPLLAALALAPLFAWFVWRRLGRRRARQARRDPSHQGPPDVSPRGRLVAHSRSIRDLIAEQFGAGWRAKTTEELAAEPRLADVLGPDPLRELIRFLDEVDQLKFAPERSNHHPESLERELTAWEPRIVQLKNKIQARPDEPTPKEKLAPR